MMAGMGKANSWSSNIRYPEAPIQPDPFSWSRGISGQQCIESILNSVAELVDTIQTLPAPGTSSKPSSRDKEERKKVCGPIVISANSLTDLLKDAVSSEELDHEARVKVQYMGASMELGNCRSRIAAQVREFKNSLTNPRSSLHSNQEAELKQVSAAIEDLLSEALRELGCWLHHHWDHAFEKSGARKANSSNSDSGHSQDTDEAVGGAMGGAQARLMPVLPVKTNFKLKLQLRKPQVFRTQRN